MKKFREKISWEKKKHIKEFHVKKYMKDFCEKQI